MRYRMENRKEQLKIIVRKLGCNNYIPIKTI